MSRKSVLTTDRNNVKFVYVFQRSSSLKIYAPSRSCELTKTIFQRDFPIDYNIYVENVKNSFKIALHDIALKYIFTQQIVSPCNSQIKNCSM